ncbi:hypothetical protein [Allofranklinella schreckenbergeri]|nr:hypothetical protein [Allofranklinella schreckenbergeri]
MMDKKSLKKWGVGAAVFVLLLLVFGLYVDRDLMVRFAEQLWACF